MVKRNVPALPKLFSPPFSLNCVIEHSNNLYFSKKMFCFFRALFLQQPPIICSLPNFMQIVSKTALIHWDLDWISFLMVCYGIWSLDVRSRSFKSYELQLAWTAHPTNAWLDWALGNLKSRPWCCSWAPQKISKPQSAESDHCHSADEGPPTLVQSWCPHALYRHRCSHSTPWTVAALHHEFWHLSIRASANHFRNACSSSSSVGLNSHCSSNTSMSLGNP